MAGTIAFIPNKSGNTANACPSNVLNSFFGTDPDRSAINDNHDGNVVRNDLHSALQFLPSLPIPRAESPYSSPNQWWPMSDSLFDCPKRSITPFESGVLNQSNSERHVYPLDIDGNGHGSIQVNPFSAPDFHSPFDADENDENRSPASQSRFNQDLFLGDARLNSPLPFLSSSRNRLFKSANHVKNGMCSKVDSPSQYKISVRNSWKASMNSLPPSAHLEEFGVKFTPSEVSRTNVSGSMNTNNGSGSGSGSSTTNTGNRISIENKIPIAADKRATGMADTSLVDQEGKGRRCGRIAVDGLLGGDSDWGRFPMASISINNNGGGTVGDGNQRFNHNYVNILQSPQTCPGANDESQLMATWIGTEFSEQKPKSLYERVSCATPSSSGRKRLYEGSRKYGNFSANTDDSLCTVEKQNAVVFIKQRILPNCQTNLDELSEAGMRRINRKGGQKRMFLSQSDSGGREVGMAKHNMHKSYHGRYHSPSGNDVRASDTLIKDMSLDQRQKPLYRYSIINQRLSTNVISRSQPLPKSSSINNYRPLIPNSGSQPILGSNSIGGGVIGSYGVCSAPATTAHSVGRDISSPLRLAYRFVFSNNI